MFGDSLSDSGNSGVISTNAGSLPPIFPPPPYLGARFSNGPVAAENLWRAYNPSAPPLQASLLGGSNFAVGGATTGIENYIKFSDFPIAPSLKDAYGNRGNAWQLAQFGTPTFDPASSLFLVWMFPNDPFTVFATGGAGVGTFDGLPSPAGPGAIVPTAVSNIIGTLKQLASQGARHFLVPNTPDLGKIPSFQGTPLESTFSNLSLQFNASLATALSDLAQDRPDLDIVDFQTDDLFAEVKADPLSFGFTNVDDRCLASFTSNPCSDPDSYLFWDGSHPTAAGHALIGNRFYQMVRQPVPAPLPVAGGMALVGWSRILRRRIGQRQDSSDRAI
ncbi:MAG: SGNH/GDSL hydrolase family protein [Cyanobium sp.]